MGLGRGERGAAAKPRSDTSNSRESNVIIIRRPVISTLAKERRTMGLRRARDSHDIFNEQLLKEKRDHLQQRLDRHLRFGMSVECRGTISIRRFNLIWITGYSWVQKLETDCSV